MVNATNYRELDNIVEKNGNTPGAVIAILQDIQEKYRFLPEEIFTYLAGKLKMSEAQVFSIATFYENFSLEPKGKYLIKVCDGTACHVRSSESLLKCLRKTLNLSENKKTTDDLLFTVDTVSCLGACGLAPVITVNDKVYPSMTPEKVETLLKALMENESND